MITETQLDGVGDFISSHPLGEPLVMELRQRYPEIHFTYCMDDDVIAATPLREAERFNLYLIDSRNHCLSFTQDLDVATGVVVAEIEDA